MYFSSLGAGFSNCSLFYRSELELDYALACVSVRCARLLPEVNARRDSCRRHRQRDRLRKEALVITQKAMHSGNRSSLSDAKVGESIFATREKST